MNEASLVAHTRNNGRRWYDVRWNGRSVEVFDEGEERDALAYMVGLQQHGGPWEIDS